MTAAAYIAVFGLSGCGGCFSRGKRDAATADSAVLQAMARKESSAVYTVRPDTIRDSAITSSEVVRFPDPALVLAADSAAGLRIYRRAASCIACHGARAEGVAGMGSSVSDREWQRGDGSLSFLYSVIADGVSDAQLTTGQRAVMPGVRNQLSSREIFQVAAYVYAISHPGSVVADTTSLTAGAPPVAHAPPDTSRR
jgi:mono/diheme cytochrome c family protein